MESGELNHLEQELHRKQKAKQKLIRPDMFGDITYTMPETKYWFDIFSIECKTGYAKKTKSKTRDKALQ